MIRRSGAIPRKTLQARHVTQVESKFGYGTTNTYEPFECLESSFQPTSGRELYLLPEGKREKECYTVWTNTECNTAEEGTDKKSDQIMLHGKWYEVYKQKNWSSGVINHYELLVVKIDVGLEPEETP